jgi:hypothetical protein
MRAIILLWSDGLAGQRDTVVALDGSGVQLGNNGGILVLQDDHGGQVDSVTYSAKDGAAVDCFVRFLR